MEQQPNQNRVGRIGVRKVGAGVVPFIIPMGVAAVSLTVIGIASWLAYRSQMKHQVDATITNIQTDGETKKISLQFFLDGKGETNTTLSIPDRPECVYTTGSILRVRYVSSQPERVGFGTNYLLLVGACVLGAVGVILLGAAVVLALRKKAHLARMSLARQPL